MKITSLLHYKSGTVEYWHLYIDGAFVLVIDTYEAQKLLHQYPHQQDVSKCFTQYIFN